ncbi:hypothetical protein EF888_02075 [Silicimonas algicola]|uniref:Uncharacterized protein n=1 Tax=Silicimonas algicola TaxID=1826607 RepID=A0A316GBT3_9RHOB|nr:hypothetical protein [Silicimonas algicola]AZQ66020.1 hypothetical protein EF888_02075 [Silicimonas algicola]PWK58314.1 hypothetical protein C8D95_101120 [Silicimonas algicola]
MKLRSVAVMAIVLATAEPALAGAIENACLKSQRGNNQRSLCGCIQDAADITLTPSDQRLAASFFANPDRAQRVRTSDRRSDESFWERYRNFGNTAQVYCTR